MAVSCSAIYGQKVDLLAGRGSYCVMKLVVISFCTALVKRCVSALVGIAFVGRVLNVVVLQVFAFRGSEFYEPVFWMRLIASGGDLFSDQKCKYGLFKQNVIRGIHFACLVRCGAVLIP